MSRGDEPTKQTLILCGRQEPIAKGKNGNETKESRKVTVHSNKLQII